MAKLDNLFQLPSYKPIRQAQIEQKYLTKGIDLEPIFHKAHQKTLSNPTAPNHRGKGFMSSTMNGNIIGTMLETCPQYMRKDPHGRYYLALDESTRVYFKKLDNSYCPRNIPTNHVRELNSMGMLFNDFPTTILYAGFRIENDKTWDSLEGCYLVEMRDLNKTNWVSDLSELSMEMAGAAVASINIIQPIDISGDITVSLKKTLDNKKTGTGDPSTE